MPIRSGGSAEGEDLRVGGGVAGFEDAVTGGGDDFAVFCDHRAHGDFAVAGGRFCLGEGGAHEGEVEARQFAVFVHDSR